MSNRIWTVFICFITTYTDSCQITAGHFNSSGASILNVVYTSGNVSLYYAMYTPDDAAVSTTKYPTLVLIHGSGPNNHDETLYLSPLVNDNSLQTFHDIAVSLCDDFIIFTYDKRSCPNITSATSKQPACPYNLPEWCIVNPSLTNCLNYTRLMFDDFVADAIEAINFVKRMDNVNTKWIIPTGHSQGCDIVPIVASYHGLSAGISLMGAGVPINDTIIIQEQEFGYSKETIEHDIVEFELIANETYVGYEQVQILNSPAPAAFWYEWMSAGYEEVRKEYLTKLKYFLTVNSPTDTNVPPQTYMPLHEILDEIASNSSNHLQVSINVIPDLIHEMVSIKDFEVEIYNVSTKVIDTIRSWVEEITSA